MKKTLLLLIFILLTFSSIFGQSIEFINAKCEELIKKRNQLDDSIKYLSQFSKTLELLNKTYSRKISCVISTPAEATKSDAGGSDYLGIVNSGDSIQIYNYSAGSYLIRNRFVIGLIPESAIEQTKTIRKYNKLALKENKVQPTKLYSTSTYNSTTNHSSGSSSYSGTSGAKTTYTGPRGGHYYINKNGNKTYIKKK